MSNLLLRYDNLLSINTLIALGCETNTVTTVTVTQPLNTAYMGKYFQNLSGPVLTQSEYYKSCISSTSQYQSVVSVSNIYTSSDYGVTWVQVSSFNIPPPVVTISDYWHSISMSSSGQYQTAVFFSSTVSTFYVSNDYGSTWTRKYSPNGSGWYSVAISSSGQYQTVISTIIPGAIQISSDYGTTWNTSTNPNGVFGLQVAMSSSGSFQIVCGIPNGIYISNDYGNTWTLNNSSPLNNNISTLSISSSGQYISLGVPNFGIYASNDYGNTWVLNSTYARWMFSAISISSTGQYQVVVSTYLLIVKTPNLIAISTDYGITWRIVSTTPSSLYWGSVTISSAGNYIIGIAGTTTDTTQNNIYLSFTPSL